MIVNGRISTDSISHGRGTEETQAEVTLDDHHYLDCVQIIKSKKRKRYV